MILELFPRVISGGRLYRYGFTKYSFIFGGWEHDKWEATHLASVVRRRPRPAIAMHSTQASSVGTLSLAKLASACAIVHVHVHVR